VKLSAKFLLLSLLFASPALGQIVIQGNLRDITGTTVTTNAQVDFELQNYGSQIPRVSGTGAVVLVKKTFTPDVSGNIHCTGAGCTDTVYANNSITPVGTFYSVCIIIQGRTLRCNNYLINTSPWNLSTAVPLNVTPNVGPGQITIQCSPFLQLTPASTWTITHNENDLAVFVQTSDLTGGIIFPDRIDISNPNVATVTWFTPQAGRALVCHGATINIATNQPNAIVTNPVGPQTIDGNQPFTVNVPTTLNNLVSATATGTNPAVGGFLRLKAGDTINWRNAANTADIALTKNSSDIFGFSAPAAGFQSNTFLSSSANVAASGVLRLASGESIAWRNNASTNDFVLAKSAASGNAPESIYVQNQASPGTEGFSAGAFIQNGAVATVAAAGALRLHPNDTINWRNNANNADVALSKNASDQLLFNGVVVGDVSSFRATWGGVAFGMANLGAVAAFIPDKAITVTSYGYSLPPGQGLGTGCSTQPVLRVTDGSVIGPSLTVANSNGQGSLNTSLNYPALDNTLRIEISFASAGCATQWGNVNLWVQYRMQ
jgi:hypothetical protein